MKVVVTGDFSISELTQGLFLVDYPTLHGKAGFSDGYSNACQIPGVFFLVFCEAGLCNTLWKLLC